MTEIKLRFELNDKINREGLNDIFLIVTDSEGKRKIKTGISCKDEHFGVKKGVLTANDKKVLKRVLTPTKWITNKDKEASYKNDQLQKKLDEYRKAYDSTKSKDNYVNKESVIKAVNNKTTLKDVVAVFDRRIKELQDADDYPNEKGYVTTKGHLLGFLVKENKSSKIDFRHIDKAFLQKLEKYLFKTINGGECSDASVHTQMKRLRAIFNYAIAEKIITPDIYPFATYTLPSITPKYKERLSLEELNQFEAVKYDKGTGAFNAQNIFMLAVRMAGTRVEDMLTLRVKNVAGGRITFNMKKGNTKGKLKSFKITDKIQIILNHYITKKSKPDDLIFPYLPPAIDKFSNKEYKKEIGRKTSLLNKYLKTIADDACIGKKITTHISRHSFGSIMIKKTKDIKALQEAFGHSTVRQTQGYLQELNIEGLDEMMAEVDI
jgi:site-specific recombinase XerD